MGAKWLKLTSKVGSTANDSGTAPGRQTESGADTNSEDVRMSAPARLTAATCKKDGPCSEAQGASERDKFVRACKQVQKMSETAKVSGCKQVSRAISAEVEVASKFMAPASPRAAVNGQKANGDNGYMGISNQYGTDKQFDQSQQMGGAEPSGFSAQVRVKRKSSANDARDDTTSFSVGAPELRLGPKFSDGGPNQKEVTVKSADSANTTAQNGTLATPGIVPSVLSPRSISSTWKRGATPRRRPSRRQRRQTEKTASTCSVDKLGGARQEPEQEEAIVHHALVGAVNSKANLANSQDGGARELPEWNYGIVHELPEWNYGIKSARKGAPKGKGQLWAGRTQANWTQSKHGGESGQRYTPEQLQKFGMANLDQMKLFLKAPNFHSSIEPSHSQCTRR